MKLPSIPGVPGAPGIAADPHVAPARRYTSRDRTLALVTHALEQPLNIIRMSTRLLQRRPVLRRRTGTIALHYAEVDVGKLVLGLVAALRANWSAGRIRAEIQSADALVCRADAVRLEQVVGNLLDNALKFSPEGAEVAVRLSSESGFARLRVADKGCGIAREFLPHVFGLFSEAGPAESGLHGGLGIGLASVHGFVVAHGGFVKATSAGIGRGAEFSVWLPLHRRGLS